MRRANSISVVVRAPSRGLVNRLPGESADLLPARGDLSLPSSLLSLGTIRRASSLASNVRYEQGVVCSAPGYQSVVLNSSLLANLVAHWRMDELSGSRFDASPNGRTLSVVPGSVATDVGSEPGLIGEAALFAALAFFPSFLQGTAGDNLSLDVSFDSGVYAATLFAGQIADHALIDAVLLSGSYVATTFPNAFTDHVTLDAALSAGTYGSIILSVLVSDKVAADVALLSGVYQQVNSILSNSDSVKLDVSLASGTYTLVVKAGSDSDKLKLDVSLAGGAYS